MNLHFTVFCFVINSVLLYLHPGWDDGRVRGFAPETGKPLYTIEAAHGGGVTAIASYSDCQHLISGGKEGGVRIWSVEKKYIPGKNEFRYA